MGHCFFLYHGLNKLEFIDSLFRKMFYVHKFSFFALYIEVDFIFSTLPSSSFVAWRWCHGIHFCELCALIEIIIASYSECVWRAFEGARNYYIVRVNNLAALDPDFIISLSDVRAAKGDLWIIRDFLHMRFF